jgi:hypothetical protein
VGRGWGFSALPCARVPCSFAAYLASVRGRPFLVRPVVRPAARCMLVEGLRAAPAALAGKEPSPACMWLFARAVVPAAAAESSAVSCPLVVAARNFKLLDELEEAEKSSKSDRGADISLGAHSRGCSGRQSAPGARSVCACAVAAPSQAQPAAAVRVMRLRDVVWRGVAPRPRNVVRAHLAFPLSTHSRVRRPPFPAPGRPARPGRHLPQQLERVHRAVCGAFWGGV